MVKGGLYITFGISTLTPIPMFSLSFPFLTFILPLFPLEGKILSRFPFQVLVSISCEQTFSPFLKLPNTCPSNRAPFGSQPHPSLIPELYYLVHLGLPLNLLSPERYYRNEVYLTP